MLPRASRHLAPAAVAAALLLSGCGDSGEPQAQAPPPPPGLTAIKAYLLEHTQALQREAVALRRDAEGYHRMAGAVNFDYARLQREQRAAVASFVARSQKGFQAANPAYEEMEGVVAGVPELADYDVTIDAGGDASDPENAVAFTLRTPEGRVYRQPGNLNYLVETSLWGTEPRFRASGVRPDLDGDGRVEFGEAMPDAGFYLAATRELERTSRELDAAARRWRPTTQDALTALVVMTPTMSEYFEAWQNSRFIAGEAATENAFVAASRLADIADILGGLVLVYDNVQPTIARADPQQARQTAASLRSLHRFASRLREQEAAGRRFTAQDAETLGGEAQARAEAIAGQISQAAGRLSIRLET